MWQNIQKNPYVIRDRLWIGYDDTESIEIKAEWIVKQKLGGAALWSLDLDDFQGRFCKKGKYPLATTIHSVLKRADRQFFDIAFGNEENEIEEIPEEQKEFRELKALPPQLQYRDGPPRRLRQMPISDEEQDHRPNGQVLIPERRERMRALPRIRPEDARQGPEFSLPQVSRELLNQQEGLMNNELPEPHHEPIPNARHLEPIPMVEGEHVPHAANHEYESMEENEAGSDDVPLSEEEPESVDGEVSDDTAVEGVNEKLKDSAGSLNLSVFVLVFGYVFTVWL